MSNQMIKMIHLFFAFKKPHFYLVFLRLMEHLSRGKMGYESVFSFARNYGVILIEVGHLRDL